MRWPAAAEEPQPDDRRVRQIGRHPPAADAKAATEAEARARIEPVEEQVRALFGTAVWGADETTLAGGVGDLLRERGLSVAVMESLTGGLVASTLTDVAGSSDYFRGGLVTYSEATKIRYGVPAETIAEHGVVSEATAVAMATAVREALGADIGIGVTGVAGPAAHGGQPVGTTHIGVATATGRSHSEYVFAQDAGGDQAPGRDVVPAAAATGGAGTTAREGVDLRPVA